ncbi:hypothetical protein NLI96_g6845 [Meripilus lineatus]|uniref:F-box domain-containing protein n=1 Tax=Meripilus lineatus TaxID=2056292 RepID=A0AAD5V2H6_9APHY|nr:hypothetical protein NLI96_g6845 [Physisporinus lineatus]
MQSSKVPIEVCERVIDHLPVSNKSLAYKRGDVTESIQTLCACALVCRDWVPRSQHHLFRWVQFCVTHQANGFLDILTRSPHRAPLVHRLTISPLRTPSSTIVAPPFRLAYSKVMSTPKMSSTSSPPSAPVLSDRQLDVDEAVFRHELGIGGDLATHNMPGVSETDIPLRDDSQKPKEISVAPRCHNWVYKVLIRLPFLLVNLETLDLRYLPTLHPSFIRLASCFKNVKTLSLWELSNQSFSEIIQLINRLPQLKSLRVMLCQWEKPVRFSPSNRLRLETFHASSLTSSVKTDMLDWLESLQDLSGLSTLELWDAFRSSDLDKLSHILRRCTHSLKYLYLWMDLSGNDAFESLSLSGHLELEYLRMWTLLSLFSDHISTFASCISLLLSPSLVYLNIGPFEKLDLESFAASQSSWKDIDDSLCDPRFSRLSYFVISPDTSYEGNHDRKTLQATF